MCLNWCDATPVWATSALRLVEAKVEKKSLLISSPISSSHTLLSLPHKLHVISGRGKSLVCKGAKAGKREYDRDGRGWGWI